MSLRVLARTVGTPLYGMIFSYFFDKQRIAEVRLIFSILSFAIIMY